MEKVQVITFKIIRDEIKLERFKESFDVESFDSLAEAKRAESFNDSKATIIMGDSLNESPEFISNIHSFKEKPLFIWSNDFSFTAAFENNVDGIFNQETSIQELLWKVSTPIKKYCKINQNENVFIWNELSLDWLTAVARYKSTDLRLTSIEFKVLNFLCRHSDEIVSRETIKDFVWPSEIVTDKTLNTHLTNLRNKLRVSHLEIKSFRSQGIQII